MKSEKTMKLRAKHGKILREPNRKKRMNEKGAGPMNGPQGLKCCPFSLIYHTTAAWTQP